MFEELLVDSETESLFGKKFLVTLFKYCENTCGWKSVMEKHVVVFKQWKLGQNCLMPFWLKLYSLMPPFWN